MFNQNIPRSYWKDLEDISKEAKEQDIEPKKNKIVLCLACNRYKHRCLCRTQLNFDKEYINDKHYEDEEKFSKKFLEDSAEESMLFY